MLTDPQVANVISVEYLARTATPTVLVSVSVDFNVQLTDAGEQDEDAVTSELFSTIVVLNVAVIVAGSTIVCTTGMAITIVLVAIALSVDPD